MGEEDISISPDTRTPSLVELSSRVQREQEWEKTLSEFNQRTDRLGLDIDKGVLETVVGLNATKINTVQSCEGHTEHGTESPYVDIAGKGTEAMEDKFYALIRQPETEEQARALGNEIEESNQHDWKKAFDVLDSFYKNRQVPYDQRLIIRPYGVGRGRIESQGAQLQKGSGSSPEEKQHRLGRYQEEMHAFGTHLKQSFLNRPSPQLPPQTR